MCFSACSWSVRLNEGRSIHGYLIRSFFRSSIYLDTALIDMYCKYRKVTVPSRVFENTTQKNLACWNAMILGHCIPGNPEDGIRIYDKMVGRTNSKGNPDSTKV